MSTAKESSEQAMFVSGVLSGTPKRRCFRISACVLFPVVHLLLELLCFFLVGKR